MPCTKSSNVAGSGEDCAIETTPPCVALTRSSRSARHSRPLAPTPSTRRERSTFCDRSAPGPRATTSCRATTSSTFRHEPPVPPAPMVPTLTARRACPMLGQADRDRRPPQPSDLPTGLHLGTSLRCKPDNLPYAPFPASASRWPAVVPRCLLAASGESATEGRLGPPGRARGCRFRHLEGDRLGTRHGAGCTLAAPTKHRPAVPRPRRPVTCGLQPARRGSNPQPSDP